MQFLLLLALVCVVTPAWGQSAPCPDNQQSATASAPCVSSPMPLFIPEEPLVAGKPYHQAEEILAAHAQELSQIPGVKIHSMSVWCDGFHIEIVGDIQELLDDKGESERRKFPPALEGIPVQVEMVVPGIGRALPGDVCALKAALRRERLEQQRRAAQSNEQTVEGNGE